MTQTKRLSKEEAWAEFMEKLYGYVPKLSPSRDFSEAWQARQPEIDELRAALRDCADALDVFLDLEPAPSLSIAGWVKVNDASEATRALLEEGE